mmetsp:Transcript_59327/g.180917  ORF Transcript_59327/g.180917 Transcript_59327/m.180917 type:complete len:575 (-) Transcript_59327:815-2539(-)
MTWARVLFHIHRRNRDLVLARAFHDVPTDPLRGGRSAWLDRVAVRPAAVAAGVLAARVGHPPSPIFARVHPHAVVLLVAQDHSACVQVPRAHLVSTVDAADVPRRARKVHHGLAPHLAERLAPSGDNIACRLQGSKLLPDGLQRDRRRGARLELRAQDADASRQGRVLRGAQHLVEDAEWQGGRCRQVDPLGQALPQPPQVARFAANDAPTELGRRHGELPVELGRLYRHACRVLGPRAGRRLLGRGLARGGQGPRRRGLHGRRVASGGGAALHDRSIEGADAVEHLSVQDRREEALLVPGPHGDVREHVGHVGGDQRDGTFRDLLVSADAARDEDCGLVVRQELHAGERVHAQQPAASPHWRDDLPCSEARQLPQHGVQRPQQLRERRGRAPARHLLGEQFDHVPSSAQASAKVLGRRLECARRALALQGQFPAYPVHGRLGAQRPLSLLGVLDQACRVAPLLKATHELAVVATRHHQALQRQTDDLHRVRRGIRAQPGQAAFDGGPDRGFQGQVEVDHVLEPVADVDAVGPRPRAQLPTRLHHRLKSQQGLVGDAEVGRASMHQVQELREAR